MIRRMELEDVQTVSEMAAAIFSDAWTYKGFKDALNQTEALMLVAVSDDETNIIEGYCCLYMALDEGEIVSVAVDPKYRQKGVGKQMLTEMISQAAKRGIAHFFLEVRKSNTLAQILYKKMGFETIGVRKNFYSKPAEDAIIMTHEV